MVAESLRGLGGFGDRIALVHSDLLSLELEERGDAVFSNAVFHWIFDHDALFRRLPAALKTGGGAGGQGGGGGGQRRRVAPGGEPGVGEGALHKTPGRRS